MPQNISLLVYVSAGGRLHSTVEGSAKPFAFSRMRSRRVPVLRLGSRGPGSDARSLRCVRKASASVRKRSQAFASVRKCSQASAKRPQSVPGVSDLCRTCRRRKSSRNAELSSLFSFRITKVSTVTGIGGVVFAKRRTVVTFGLASGLRVSKVSTVTGIGGVVVAKRRTVVTFGIFWTRLGSSRLKSVNSDRDQGGRGRETQNCRHFWTRLGSSRLKSVNSHGDPGGSWSRNAELSTLLDSPRVFASQQCQQSQGSGGVVVAKRRTVVTFGLASGLRVSKVSTVTGIGGVVVAKRRTVVTFGLASGLRVSKVSTVTGIQGGRGRETQNCRHFWNLLDSPRVFASQKCQQ